MITKIAQEFTEDVGFLPTRIATNRATRHSDSGVGVLLADKQLIADRLKKGLGGAAGGAGIGALLGLLAHHPRLGALIGGSTGFYGGKAKADYDYLRDKGIETRLGGLLGSKMTRAAKKQYAY